MNDHITLEDVKRHLSGQKLSNGKNSQNNKSHEPKNLVGFPVEEIEELNKGAESLANSVKITLYDQKVEFLPVSQLKKVEYYDKVPIDGRESIIENSLSDNGFAEPIIVNRRESGELFIIDGFQRSQVWKLMGKEEIPTLILEVPDQQEKELHIFFNQQEFSFNMDTLPDFMKGLDLKHFGLHEPDYTPDNANRHSDSEKNARMHDSDAITSKKFRIWKSDDDLFQEICKKLKSEKGLKNQAEVFVELINFYNENA